MITKRSNYFCLSFSAYFFRPTPLLVYYFPTLQRNVIFTAGIQKPWKVIALVFLFLVFFHFGSEYLYLTLCIYRIFYSFYWENYCLNLCIFRGGRFVLAPLDWPEFFGFLKFHDEFGKVNFFSSVSLLIGLINAFVCITLQ